MNTKKHTLLLGAHMSVAGGYDKAIERGQSINCTTIQIFTKNNRQWYAKPITEQETQLFKTAFLNSNIQSVFVHASYLINIGSAQPETRTKSLHGLINELNRCHTLDVKYLVLHPGSAGTLPIEECIKYVAQNINTALEQSESDTIILLETMAGQGSTICHTFEQLAQIIALCKDKKRIGVCADTCHLFAAGYDLRTPEAYDKTWKDYDAILGLDTLKAIHINDSKKALGCRVDRHEEIGRGQMGVEAFSLLFNDPRFYGVPKILETPNDNLSCYAHNMAVIKGLLTHETIKKLNIE